MTSDILSQKKEEQGSLNPPGSPDILEVWIIEVIEELRSEGFSR